jgi:hypothetical protein
MTLHFVILRGLNASEESLIYSVIEKRKDSSALMCLGMTKKHND